MSNQNEILVDIVVASGGTVTNPNNRNELLYDWLVAVGGGDIIGIWNPNGTIACGVVVPCGLVWTC